MLLAIELNFVLWPKKKGKNVKINNVLLKTPVKDYCFFTYIIMSMEKLIN